MEYSMNFPGKCYYSFHPVPDLNNEKFITTVTDTSIFIWRDGGGGRLIMLHMKS